MGMRKDTKFRIRYSDFVLLFFVFLWIFLAGTFYTFSECAILLHKAGRSLGRSSLEGPEVTLILSLTG